MPSLQITLIPFEPLKECEKALNFVWHVVSYTSEKLVISLDFDDPKCVSATSNQGDTLRIDFND